MDLQASVIIPTFEDWAGLQLCLDSLALQTVAPDEFEVIIANNNPAKELPEGLRLLPNARVIHVEKPGSYAARNAAIRVARGEVLFFTDSDCLPDPRWIEAGLAAITGLPVHAIVAGGIEIVAAGPTWTAAALYDRLFHLRQEDLVKEGWCVTANLLTRRLTFDVVGAFDEDRFSGGDNDWTHRAGALGCPIVYSAAASIRHPARASLASLAKKRRRFVGAWHQHEVTGVAPMRPLWRYLSFVEGREIMKTLTAPGLTMRERLRVLWIAYSLGVLTFFEVVRLRYLGAGARRS